MKLHILKVLIILRMLNGSNYELNARIIVKKLNISVKIEKHFFT